MIKNSGWSAGLILKKQNLFIGAGLLICAVAAVWVLALLGSSVREKQKRLAYMELAVKYRMDYAKLGIDYTARIVDYRADGDYFNYGAATDYQNTNVYKLDKDGIPQVKSGGRLFYNPVTMAQYALSVYGIYLKEGRLRKRFLFLAEKLVAQQGDDGAFRYPFSWSYYLLKDPFKPGWVSGMAQGLELSVFARAYHLTGDHHFLQAGSKALDFLILPVSRGGCMSTLRDLKKLKRSYRKNVFFEEYICSPSSYTLNGFMFILIGLYDWSRLDSPDRSKDEALDYFQKGVATLKIVLPYYDIGGFTAYDLSYLTYGLRPKSARNYHSVHIQLLNALSAITGEEEFKQYERKWISYIRP